MKEVAVMRQNTEKREKKECHQLSPMSLNFTEPRQEDRLQCHMWSPQTLPFLEAVEKDCIWTTSLSFLGRTQ